jgi:hypothetical protein
MLRATRSKLLAAPLSLLIVFAAFGAAKQNDIRIEIDTSQLRSQSAVTVWTAYLLERTAFRSKHNVPVPARGEVAPSFDEEVFARSETVQIYRELKAKDRSFHDSYWETVSQIKKAGFTRAYVWIYLRRPNWPDKQQPSNLAEFTRWSSANLKNHQAPRSVAWSWTNSERHTPRCVGIQMNLCIWS